MPNAGMSKRTFDTLKIKLSKAGFIIAFATCNKKERVVSFHFPNKRSAFSTRIKFEEGGLIDGWRRKDNGELYEGLPTLLISLGGPWGADNDVAGDTTLTDAINKSLSDIGKVSRDTNEACPICEEVECFDNDGEFCAACGYGSKAPEGYGHLNPSELSRNTTAFADRKSLKHYATAPPVTVGKPAQWDKIYASPDEALEAELNRDTFFDTINHYCALIRIGHAKHPFHAPLSTAYAGVTKAWIVWTLNQRYRYSKRVPLRARFAVWFVRKFILKEGHITLLELMSRALQTPDKKWFKLKGDKDDA